MSAPYSLGEEHRFPGSGTEYAYLVASGGIVSLDEVSSNSFPPRIRRRSRPASHGYATGG